MLNKIINHYKLVALLITSIATILSSAFFIDARYAQSAEVQLIEQRLDQKIIQDRADNLQQRIWKLEDRFGSESKMKQEIKDEYRQLKEDVQKLKQKLNVLDENMYVK